MAKTSGSITYNLTNFCKMTARIKNEIARITGVTNPDEILDQGWKSAYNSKKYRVKGDMVTFFIDATPFAHDTWIEVLLKKSREGEPLPYFTYGANLQNEPPREYSSLEDFICVRPELYEELAHIALEEPWSFTGEDNELLRFYLNGTFLRLADEGKIGYAADAEGSMCVWCTGLVNVHYEDIYCFCTPNDHVGLKQEWIARTFCTLGSMHSGQRLRRAFGTTPPPRANYFESIADTIYDGNLPLAVDYGHIMRRVHRIGIPALQVLLASSREALEVIDRAKAAEPSVRKAILRELNGLVSDSTVLRQSLHNAVALAAERARARARYMYTSALPSWNPRGGGQVSFCLPLCLVVEERVDTVLVARLVKDAKDPFYEGKTLFDLPMAYRNVRAIQRTDGMTGWISSAFTEVSDIPVTSAFATVMHTSAKEHESKDGFSTTLVTDKTDPVLSRAKLVPEADGLPKLMVCDGDTVGVVRRENDVLPRIQLRTNEDLRTDKEWGVSQIHGRFSFKDGTWTYTHEGKNWSQIVGGNGSVTVLNVQGQSATIAYGDYISFTYSPKYRFDR